MDVSFVTRRRAPVRAAPGGAAGAAAPSRSRPFRKQRAKALKADSRTWCALSPRQRASATEAPMPRATARQKTGVWRVRKVPTNSRPRGPAACVPYGSSATSAPTDARTGGNRQRQHSA